MIDLTLWKAKRSLKRIRKMEKNLVKFQSYVDRTNEWKKEEQARLNLLLKGMSEEEFLLFANETGYGWNTEDDE